MRFSFETVEWCRPETAVGSAVRSVQASLTGCAYNRYQNVRIDAVHYCEREYELSEKRKRKSFFERNGDPKDAPRERLLLFMRTVRDYQNLAGLVRSLRVPYMTREACKAELARTVAVLANIRYVDLPEGFYSDDNSSLALKQELLASCSDIRRMKFSFGSEKSFADLPRTRNWQSLEILELSRLDIEPQTLLYVLNSFPILRDLKCIDLAMLDDSVFRPSPSVPAFPPVQRLTLQNIPKVHAGGLATYLAQPQSRDALIHLALTATGVQVQHLHHVTSRAPYLESLSIVEDVQRSFPYDPPAPPLSSTSLRYLHFEITSIQSPRGSQSAAESYYTYLMTSVLSNTLPALRDLYVRDSTFPETLLLTHPAPPFSDQASSPTRLQQPLCVYTKGLDELEWNFTSVEPSPVAGRTGSASKVRPVSLMGAESLSSAWGGHARKSVMVGNGFGGFLAVPTEEATRPSSSGTAAMKGKREKKADIWR